MERKKKITVHKVHKKQSNHKIKYAMLWQLPNPSSSFKDLFTC
jgi:hypothetical protein